MKLILPDTLATRMREWLEEHYPHEACGFFAGTDDGMTREVEDLWVVPNISTENLRRRFVVDPMDYLKSERRAQEGGRSLLGVFHSHPDHPAIPSEHDLKSAQPFFSYIIVSVKQGKTEEIKSYRLEGEAFIPEEVQVKSLKHVP